MSTNYFPRLTQWRLARGVFAASLAAMARDGQDGNEGVVFWLGTREGEVAHLSHAVAVRGGGVVQRPDHLRLPPAVLNEVTDLTLSLGVSLLGQIHSHGPGYGVDLSRVDHACGIRVPWFLSAVAPDFALRPTTELAACGLHVFEPDHGYRRLTHSEVAERVRLTNDEGTVLPVVGEDWS